MNKYLIGAIVLIIIVFTLYSFSNNNDVVYIPSVASAIIVIEPPHDFGDIDIFSGKVSTTYTLKNEGAEDVSILSAVTSCMCTEGEIGGLVFGMHESSEKIIIIPAEGEKILTVTYDPLAHGPNGVGKVKRELFLKTNSTITPKIKITFSANVVKNNNE